MIKKRLMELMPQAKKHIALQVMWKWFSLICQILMVWIASVLLDNA